MSTSGLYKHRDTFIHANEHEHTLMHTHSNSIQPAELSPWKEHSILRKLFKFPSLQQRTNDRLEFN